MRDTLIDRLHHEARIILHITRRDRAKRIAAAGLMVVLMVYCDRPVAAALIGLAVAVTEILFVVILRYDTALGETGRMTGQMLVFSWLNSTASTLAFCAPAVVLVSVPSVPMLIAALFWLFGIFVHITNTFVDLPLYNRSEVIPSYGALFVAIYVASQTDHAHGPLHEWIMLVIFAGMYGLNTWETISMQADTRKQLNTARAKAQSRLRALERIARHDPLTGLRNRTAFEDDFTDILRAAESSEPPVLMVIDLDGFKPINDSYGHNAGDDVLKAVGQRLATLSGDRGIAARIGGDEFALGLRSVADAEEALTFARKVAEAMEAPVPNAGPELRVGASVGLTLAEPGMTDVRRLTTEADQAMYRAKTDPGAVAVLFDQSFAPRLSLSDRDRIRNALSNGAFKPFYQPKIDLRTGQTIGYEALARWTRRDGTTWSPGVFMPQIVELGLHAELLETMTSQVLADLPRLTEAGLRTGRVAINLPETALATRAGRSAFLGLVDGHPGAMDRLTLEITEDVLISRTGSLLQDSIAAFRERGARISLDDFGTGYASFQHLRQLDFDELKIDRSFVSGLCTDGTAAVLVEGFLSIARGLHVAVVAEGVETEAQEKRLQALGCPQAQGFRYGKAQPIAETETRLIAERAEARLTGLQFHRLVTRKPDKVRHERL